MPQCLGLPIAWGIHLAVCGVMIALAPACVNAQEKKGANRQRLVRDQPSAVEATPRTVLVAGGLVVGLLAAGIFTAVLRRRSLPRKPQSTAKDEMREVIPVFEPMARRAAKSGTKAKDDIPVVIPVVEPVASPAIAMDELPPTSIRAPGPEHRATVPRAVMESLAYALQSAGPSTDAGRRLCRRLQARFVSVDDAGACWTFGIETGTWFRLENGEWVNRLPPPQVYLDGDVIEQLRDLQRAFS